MAGAPYERIVNTLALILRAQAGGPYYLHAYDGWQSADALNGAWQRVGQPMPELDSITEQVAAHVPVDLLNGKGAPPTLYVRDTPAELIVFRNQPDFQPVGTTGLLWAANTTSDVLFDSGNNQFYILVAGRWFRSNLIAGLWSFISSKDLPAYSSEIPTGSPAGVVLSTVAGTPQAKEPGSPVFTRKGRGQKIDRPVLGVAAASVDCPLCRSALSSIIRSDTSAASERAGMATLKAYQPVKRLSKKVRRGFGGYPVATIAFYGPDAGRASKWRSVSS